MVKRTLGLKILPNISTVSRRLASADPASVHRLRGVNRSLVLDRLTRDHFSRITLDFDGSVLSTKRRKHRSGLQQEEEGVEKLLSIVCHHRANSPSLRLPSSSRQCARLQRRHRLYPTVLGQNARDPSQHPYRSRMDSAFFSEDLLDRLHRENVEFTISVPFERFTELKSMSETCKDWSRINHRLSFFEATWKPKSWSRFDPFIFVRKRVCRTQGTHSTRPVHPLRT